MERVQFETRFRPTLEDRRRASGYGRFRSAGQPAGNAVCPRAHPAPDLRIHLLATVELWG